MAVTVKAWDIPGGDDSIEVGTYDSVQMTGTLVRDQDGNVIAELRFGDSWAVGDEADGHTPQKSIRYWSDITVESVPA